VLRKPEVSAKFVKHYVGAHADFGELELDDKDPRHAMIQRHNRASCARFWSSSTARARKWRGLAEA